MRRGLVSAHMSTTDRSPNPKAQKLTQIPTYLLLIGAADGGTKANACAAAAQHAAAAAATPEVRILPARER